MIQLDLYRPPFPHDPKPINRKGSRVRCDGCGKVWTVRPGLRKDIFREACPKPSTFWRSYEGRTLLGYPAG